MLKYIVITLCGFPVIMYSCGFAFWVLHRSGNAFASQAFHTVYCTCCKCAFEVLISSGDFLLVLPYSSQVTSLVTSGSGHICCKTPWRGAGDIQEKQDCSGGEVHSALTSARRHTSGWLELSKAKSSSAQSHQWLKL